jgi:BirA family transcriptional regulator, biotin operon repressor / biotin---[acetyl-CoA-carboxylase] ligase
MVKGPNSKVSDSRPPTRNPQSVSDLAQQDFPAALAARLQTRFLGKPLHYFAALDSTNTYALQLARQDTAEGTIVIADSQQKGKGRLGRTWVSPPHVNIYLSVILRPAVSIAAAPQINLLAGVAVADTIAQDCGLTPTIKWPNDVLVDGKKVCGILAEMQTTAEALRAVVLGIGVNLNAPLEAFPPELRDKASSLLLAGGQAIERAAFTASLLAHLEKVYVLWLEQGFAAVRAVWENYAAGLHGQRIAVAAPEGTMTGVVLGLDDDGALLLQREPGAPPHRVLVGDVTVIGGYQRGEHHHPRS